MKKSSLLLTLFFIMVAWSCEKNRNRDFPIVDVREFLVLNNPSNDALRSVGGVVTHPGGLRGLIVYRRFINQDRNDFAAYDRACPTHFEQECGVLEISDDGIFAICPCENEKYLLFDGSPGDGAEVSLVPYSTTFDGATIVVSN